MTKPGQEYTTEVKQKVFEFRAQGLSWPEVAQRLQAELGVAVPHKTLVWWSRTPDAKAMIAELRQQVAAMVDEGAHSAVPKVLEALEAAVEAKAARDVDAYSRALVNLTRGVVAERVELAPPQATEDTKELAALLARHGVRLDAQG